MKNVYYNLARMYTETTGDSDVTLTTAVPGCKTFALAGCSDSGEYEYGLITYDLVTHRPTGSEVGIGKYISSGTVFKRTTVEASTDSDNSAISLTGLTEIYLTPIASSYNAGFNPFGSYYGSNVQINDDSDADLTIDTEWVDANNLFTLAGNTITFTYSGWYRTFVNVALSTVLGGALGDGYVRIEFQPFSLNTYRSYLSAAGVGINEDTISLEILLQITAGNTLQVHCYNAGGAAILANVYELTIIRLGNYGL